MPNNPNPKKIYDQDTELIEKINSGRQDLFERLVLRYEQKLFNFGYRMCGDASDSEDLVQETFLNTFKYLTSFRFETKFKNWLYRVAASICIKKRRKSKHAPERELSLDEFIPREGEHMPSEIPNWASLPLDNVLNNELANIIKEAILSLPKKYRLVIVLRDLEGFSTLETAEILKLTASNVKVRLHRARLFLREHLKSYFSHDK